MQKILKINSLDNVAVVVSPTGLLPGENIFDEVSANTFIPMGHKVAMCHIKKGEAIIRYGYPIALAHEDLIAGQWVNEQNTTIPPSPDLETLVYEKPKVDKPAALEGYGFMGYKNPDGSVGTKNILGISMSVQCVGGIADFVVEKIKTTLLPKYPNVDDVMAINHSYGCGVAIDAPAAIIPQRTLKNITQNPNFGGEVMIIGLGCEKLRPETLIQNSKEDSIVYLQDESLTGFEAMVAQILATADSHLQKLNQRKRTFCPASDLVVGMQCGGSDAFSGISGNPVAGFAADLLVRAGGTVFFSEITEVRDAVAQLHARCINQEVAQKLLNEMKWYDEYLAKGSADRTANTTPGNKKGGLSNIVEKALGSVVKSGTSPIMAVVSPGEKVKEKGLNFVATPASDFVCGTLQLAAGMNLHLFITGRGTPYGLNMVPVVKISSNTTLANRWFDLIDFDAGPVVQGKKSIEELGWELFHYMLKVASGTETVATDQLGIYNDLALFNPGPLT